MSVIVIAGAGHAAGQAAASLRQKGHTGELIIVGDEPYLPYQRPPLSKAYLSGKEQQEHLYVRQAAFYEKQNIDVRTGIRISEIARADRLLRTSAGELAYDQLLLTTGARPRQLQTTINELAGIHYLRTITDVDRIRDEMAGAQNVCIIGGGYIGLEVAAVAASAGKNVSVLEMGERVLQRVATPELSAFYHQLHSEHGVAIHVGTRVTGFVGQERVSAVVCGDRTIETDLVIVGIGIVPNVELAEAAGLECADGIVVDESCRTSDPVIFAAGDCTNHPSPQLGRRLRLESVPNALDQARVAAVNMLGGNDIHDSVPWFWSDQYHLKLQMVGFSADGDRQVIRGSMAEHEFAVFHLRGERLMAVDAVNRPRDFIIGKRLFGQQVDSARLADPDDDLKS